MKIFLLAACLLGAAIASPHHLRTGNPDEHGNMFQGDIHLPLPLMNKNGLLDERYRWTGGHVPYSFDSSILADQRTTIESAMADYISLTSNCIHFHERTDEANYILFDNDGSGGCWSYVGMQGGEQNINYPVWCTNSYGSTMHEMYHALGFYHEQSRTDRDDYVIIHYENIQSGAEHNFDKYSALVIGEFGEEYDYGSVMHYSRDAFSDNGLDTIETIDAGAQDIIGQRDGLSDSDLRKLMNMYNC